MYYSFEIKQLESGIKFFFKWMKKYSKSDEENWKNSLNLVAKSKKTATSLMVERDFLEKLNMEPVVDIKTSRETIKVFKNNDLLFYKIQSKENIESRFSSKEILISKEFFVDNEYFKYVILKISWQVVENEIFSKRFKERIFKNDRD